MHREIDTPPAANLTGGAASAARLAVDGRFLSRGGRTVNLHGVAYGPFSPNSQGQPFPEVEVVASDLDRMTAIGINALRVYHRPAPAFLDQLAQYPELGVVVDIPWSKHLCFLHNSRACREARAAIRSAVEEGRNQPAILAYSIGNEIPADIVRWHGARRIERFLQELADVARQADPNRLITYANYPPTEYLDLSFLDFATFNVYLHDPETFRRYLLRLMNLVGDKPLVLGEIGMDTLRHGESEQAQFLAGHVREATLSGLAGSFVFSWTDEWFTGRHAIVDWAFGITRADRSPKESYRALGEAFAARPLDLLAAKTGTSPNCRDGPEGAAHKLEMSPFSRLPKVSVVVCSYNGGSTLAHCLETLTKLNYPDYEVILVDDGSTDDTRAIAARFPNVTTIHQQNLGLGAARNIGLKAATGEFVAYTDSDCMAHADWLTHLVAQFERSGADAVGGPNLAPPAGRVAACVAASPGQPMHVLESDQVAEHIPGCNMAFRRKALAAINGFDEQFRKAGDDVDICWRLQAAGYWISFAPAAMVWHHRRQTPRAYLRQQAGYGEAEALLRFKHPDRFNGRGQGKWSGMLYGASLQGLVLDQAIIYRGTFGTSPFQCIYQPGPSHWAMIPSTLEWHMAAAVGLIFGIFWTPLLAVVAGMLATSSIVAWLQALQARLPGCHEGWKSRLCVAGLCYAQPLVRAAARYRTRYFAFHAPTAPGLESPRSVKRSWRRTRSAAFWGAGLPERTKLIQGLIAYLDAHRCGKTIDTGWSDSDLEVFRDVWTNVSVSTVQEEHGGGNRVIRVRTCLHTSTLTKIFLVVGAALVSLVAPIKPAIAVAWVAAVVLSLSWAWYRGAGLHAKIAEVIDDLARQMSMVHVRPEGEAGAAGGRAAFRRSDGQAAPASSESVHVPVPVPSDGLAAAAEPEAVS